MGYNIFSTKSMINKASGLAIMCKNGICGYENFENIGNENQLVIKITT